MKKLWKVLAVLLVIVVSVATSSQAAKAVTDFKDLSPYHPYYEDVAWAVEKGIVSGYADGTFKPDNPVSRGEYAIFVHRLFGKDWFGPTEAQYIDLRSDKNIDAKKGTAYYLPACFVEYYGGVQINFEDMAKAHQVFLTTLPLLRWEFCHNFAYFMHDHAAASSWKKYGNIYFLRDGLKYAEAHNLETPDYRIPKGYCRPGGDDSYKTLRKYTYGGVALFHDANILPDFPDGNFHVNAKVTRAELMHALRRIDGIFTEINAKQKMIDSMNWLKDALGPIEK